MRGDRTDKRGRNSGKQENFIYTLSLPSAPPPLSPHAPTVKIQIYVDRIRGWVMYSKRLKTV
jgi:hypothetical protein